jgi:ATP-dependent helicase HrpB
MEPAPSLPIHDLDEEIVLALRRGNRLVIEAPTGSGKSTQVPQILLDGGVVDRGRIVVLQPRRLPARMLARRVAAERGSPLGGEVGYQIRLDNVSSAETRILYATEGVLLRRMVADPLLRGIDAIVFDEFHERHLHGDITLAAALDLQEGERPDLRIVVMSATLDGEALEHHLAPVEVLRSTGRMHPVEVVHLRHEPGNDPVWELAADAVASEFGRTDGDALVFMPGAWEIRRTIEELRSRLGGDCSILPLHGELPPAEQDKAVGRAPGRKVVVSTNVAETSLTIDGITLVVDSGLARVARFDPRRGINTLFIEKISDASAAQRAGRAGRTAPGRCVRLWTQRDHERRPRREVPEIHRLDLAEALLMLKASGVGDVAAFRWIEPPDPAAIARAVSLLRDLGALDADGGLTATGRRMAGFPVHPRYARMFLEADSRRCVRAASLIAAITQTRSMLLRVDRRIAEERREVLGGGDSDFRVLMNAFEWAAERRFRRTECATLGIHAEAARQVGALREQFLDIAHGEGLWLEDGEVPWESVARCVLAGFADQVARRRGAGTLQCDIVHGRRGVLARDSAAASSDLLVAAEISEIEGADGDARTSLSLATGIREEWLREEFPDDFEEQTAHVFEKSLNRVVVRRAKVFRDLVIESRDRDAEAGIETSMCLAAKVDDGTLRLNGWNDEVEQWFRRVNFLAAACPDFALPVLGDDERRHVVLLVCEGSTCYRDIKDAPVLPHARSLLDDAGARMVDRHAPERIELPCGRKAKIVYPADGEPRVAGRIQELYGLEEGLTIAAGRHALTIEVLAPNQRPVQVTKDLTTFWKETYPALKQQLSRRYPRHEWR